MLKQGDKVRVRQGLVDGAPHGIIECTKDHIEASGMEGEVINVFGKGIGYQVSFDPGLTFAEDMLELIEQAKVNEKKVVVSTSVETKRQIVSKRLRNYKEMINKLEEVDRDMFFGMLYDKLESILYETYGE